jgi:hypothetical protein
MPDPIRIDALTQTNLDPIDFEFPAMFAGQTYRVRGEQIRGTSVALGALATGDDAGDVPFGNGLAGLPGNPTHVQSAIEALAARGVNRTYAFGSTLANNSSDAVNDVDVSLGTVHSQNGTRMVLASTVTKRLDGTWAVGSGNGGLDTGTKAVNSTYHVYVIMRPDTGVVDAILSLSATGPALPTNYTEYRRRGAVLTDGSGNIRAFQQFGTEFRIGQVTDATMGTSAQALMAVTVPNGLPVKLLGSVYCTADNATGQAFTAPGDKASLEKTIATTYAQNINHITQSEYFEYTNSSRQIYRRTATTGGSSIFYTHGWDDFNLLVGV